MKLSRLVPLSFVAVVSFSLMLSPASAQDIEYEKVMIPIFFSEPIQGGGRFFETRLAILNSAPAPVSILPYDYGCRLAACDQTPPTPPGITFFPSFEPYAREGLGFFLNVEKQHVDSVTFDLRVREVTDTENWNAKIPVVRERDLRTDKLNLLGIPVSDSVRQTVRIDDFDNRENSRVMVRIFGTRPFLKVPFREQPDFLLFERELAFVQLAGGPAGANRTAYIQVGDFQRLAGSLYPEVRVEIESRTEGLRFWAFASINDSLTKSISIIAP